MSRRGLAAWALGSLFFFYAFVLRVSPSVMVDDLMRDFGVSALVLGNLSAFYFYAYAGAQVPIGVLMDRLGPRRLMSSAALLCGIGCACFSAADAVGVAYAGRFLIGLGCAFSWVGTLTIIGQWLPARHFAAFTGGGQFAGTAGAIVGQAPLAVVVDSAGWRPALGWLALGGGVLAVALWLVVRDRSPSDVSRHGLLHGLGVAARNPQTWLVAGVGMSLTGPVLAFAGLWGVPWFAATHGVDRTEAARLLALVFIGWLVAAPLVGWLSDRMGKRRPLLVAGSALSSVTMLVLVLWSSASMAALALLLFLNGVGGACMVVSFAAGREHNPPFAGGAALGIVNTCVVGSGALFQPLIGWLLDLGWDGRVEAGIRLYPADAFRSALLVLPVAGLLGLVLALSMREPARRRATSRR